MSRPTVTVAVVSWNTRELLERCLESLRPDAGSGRAEVWVVDNASSDGSAAAVRQHFGWVKLVEAGKNLGFGRAVNLVAQRTDTPWVVAANADLEVEPGTVGALLDAGGRHSEAGALAPRLVRPSGEPEHSVYAFPSPGLAVLAAAPRALVPRGVAERRLLPGAFDPDREREVPWAVGAFLMVRRSAWEEVGGFPADQWMYTEDLDLGWRLAAAGHPTRYVPGARVMHVGGASTRQVFGEGVDARWMDASHAWYLRRRGRPRAVLFAGISLASASLRYCAVLTAARIRPARFAALRASDRAWLQAHGRGLRAALRAPP